jgi:hypothetical protein
MATGAPFPPPLDAHDRHLFIEVLPVYAKGGDGAPLTGADLDAWIRWCAEMYARATLHLGSLHSGLNVKRWADWLKAGGHLKPCVRVGFFGCDALGIYAEIYQQSRKRNYGSYVSSGNDDEREAAKIAEELCAKVLAHGEKSGLDRESMRKLAEQTMALWSKQYLRLDGYNGGTQYVKQKHCFRYLSKNTARYGVSWEEAVPVENETNDQARVTARQKPAGPGEYDWRAMQGNEEGAT